jgi:predicted nicotinamide N-methyase
LKYPLQIQKVSLPNGPQNILVPDITLVRKQYEDGRLNSFPYWSAIWPSSVALSVFIQQNPELIKNKILLELAAGLGLPSLVAAAYAQTIYCTDMDADAVQIAAESAKENSIKNMHCACMNWNDIPAGLHADILLLSDVNYDTTAFAELLQVIQRFIKQGTTILLATPQRLMAKPFIEQLLFWCNTQQQILAHLPDGNSAEIIVYILTLNKDELVK